jgi:phosphate-selective porin OprO and OprP
MKKKVFLVGLMFTLMLLAGSFEAFAMSEQELRIRALEEKIEALQPQISKGATYDTHGVKKQGIKRPFFGGKGFHFESDDGKFSTNLQFRAQMRFSNPGDGDPKTLADYSKTDTSNFDLQRVRLKIGGHGYQPWLKYYFELDLQPSKSSTSASNSAAPRIIDWRIDVQPWEEFGFRVGQWKVNYNRERVDSSGRQQFVDRSIVNSIFTIDRQIGAMVQGRLNKGKLFDMRYYAGLFNGEGRASNNDNNEMMKMARLQWNVLGGDLKFRQSDIRRHAKPTLQIAGAWAGNRGRCTEWGSSGCSALKGFTDPTSAGSSATLYDVDQYVEEVAFKYQGLSIQHEYHWKNVKNSETGAVNKLKGSYAQAGYFFNELNKSIPEQLELAFRYAFVDEPDSADITKENTRKEYTVAANYFIAGHNNKITVDYSYLTLDHAPSNQLYDENRVRLQWDISF